MQSQMQLLFAQPGQTGNSSDPLYFPSFIAVFQKRVICGSLSPQNKVGSVIKGE